MRHASSETKATRRSKGVLARVYGRGARRAVGYADMEKKKVELVLQVRRGMSISARLVGLKLCCIKAQVKPLRKAGYRIGDVDVAG